MISEEIIYNFLSKKYLPKNPDFMLVLGSSDLRVPKFAAEYFLSNPLGYVVISGGLGKVTNEIWKNSEAQTFAQIMIEMGVPETKIYLEERASNTGENILFSKKVILQNNLVHEEGLLIAKPYMTRRAFNTASQQWPEVKWAALSEPLNYEEYLSAIDDKDTFLHLLVGDLQRIKTYGEMGFQISDEIPQLEQDAFEKLVERGYDRYVFR